MKKIFLTLSAILFVFSTNTNAFAQSNSRTSNGGSTGPNLNGFQTEDGMTVNLVTRRYGGGHRHSYGGHNYKGHRFGGQRSHRFGYGHGGFRFNYYRPYYKSYRNYYQKPYRGYNSYGGRGYSGHNHRSHDSGRHNSHNRGHRHGGHSSHNNRH